MYSKSVDLYKDSIGKVEYVDHMGTDLSVINSARVSFGVQKDELDDRDKKLIKYLIKHKHTSVLEHNCVTFRFTVPLYVRSQHHRHRTWSYNEISRRYTDVNIKFYEPQAFRTQHKSNRQASNAEELIDPNLNWLGEDATETNAFWDGFVASKALKKHHKNSLRLYNLLRERGVCREQARGVLPQNMYTEYYGTVNLSNLLKFIDLRTHEGAQWEIQKLAEACLEIATDLFPETVGAFRENRKS